MIASVLLLGAIIYMSYTFYKKRKEKGYLLRPPEPPRPAHEVALESLEALNNKLTKEKQLAVAKLMKWQEKAKDTLRKDIDTKRKAIDLRHADYEVLLPLERFLTLDIDIQAHRDGYSPCTKVGGERKRK